MIFGIWLTSTCRANFCRWNKLDTSISIFPNRWRISMRRIAQISNCSFVGTNVRCINRDINTDKTPKIIPLGIWSERSFGSKLNFMIWQLNNQIKIKRMKICYSLSNCLLVRLRHIMRIHLSCHLLSSSHLMPMESRRKFFLISVFCECTKQFDISDLRAASSDYKCL